MKVVFIVPYYGTFPNYFNLFIDSCANNSDYNWLIVSDIHYMGKLPHNVCFLKLSWTELQTLFQKKFDFEIKLDKPYKLCDFRPAYGYVFHNYIRGYDYWGYCDIDLIFGDLRAFLPKEKIQEYDKVGHLGHLSLYRNSDIVNKLFMCKIDGIARYKEVFTSDKSCIFDEWNWISINHIFLKSNKKVWMFDQFFDIYPYDDNFRKVVRKVPQKNKSYGQDIIEKSISFATVENGKAFQWKYCDVRWRKTEVAYIHFQKRNMQVLVDETMQKILCVPDRFIPMKKEIISHRYVWRAKVHRLFNKKKIKWKSKKILFWVIVKTSPVRHLLRKSINHKGE